MILACLSPSVSFDLVPIESGAGACTVEWKGRMSHRTVPAPWRVETTEGGHFVVKDATGFSICYVYALKDVALRSSCMSPYGSRGDRRGDCEAA
jgi:hypothetical protein